MYSLPFVHGQNVIELGGGDRPSFRPNLDIRLGPNVDIVADLNEQLPIENNAYDGVFSMYLIEHLSWRKVRAFISETFRILKPGGKVVIVTANLLEQCRLLVNTKEWSDNEVCCLFGDQNYEGKDWTANSHNCGFSPEFAIKLFRAAGYQDVLVLPHPNCNTDMLIEATKPNEVVQVSKNTESDSNDPAKWTPEQRAKAYDMKYFDGARGGFGGYAYEGYRDFPVHWITYNKLMERKPESVLEIGPARGYVLKRIEDAGVRVAGLEISRHCWLTRAVEDIRHWDVTQTPWPVKDKEFDLCYSVAVMEHIPEEAIPRIVAEIERTCKRAVHGISFEDDDFDKTHTTLRTKEWWQQQVPSNHEIVDKEELEHGQLLIPGSQNDELKLNIGSFTTMFHYGWINIDVHDLEQWAHSNFYNYMKHDVRSGLPFQDGTVSMIYSSHFLEHLTHEEGLNFLKDAYRVLKPGGVIRTSVPDAKKLINSYLSGTMSDYHEMNEGVAAAAYESHKLWSLLMANHLSLYDADGLIGIIKDVGFNNVSAMPFRNSNSESMKREVFDMFPTVSLFVEATK